jgi:hypothetical protein
MNLGPALLIAFVAVAACGWTDPSSPPPGSPDTGPCAGHMMCANGCCALANMDGEGWQCALPSTAPDATICSFEGGEGPGDIGKELRRRPKKHGTDGGTGYRPSPYGDIFGSQLAPWDEEKDRAVLAELAP